MYINISFHDLTPRFAAEVKYLLDLIRQAGVRKGTLLVVPDFHGQACLLPEMPLVQQVTLLAQEGWEVVLHGLNHQESFSSLPEAKVKSPWQYIISRWYTDGEGEFYRLSSQEARTRIAQGISIFASCGLKPVGFVAPAWLLSKESYAVLNEFHFSFRTTLTRVYDLSRGVSYPAPALTFSSRSRNRVFLSRLLTPALATFWKRQELVRLVLHPPDAQHPSVQKTISKLLQKMLAFRQPVTITEYLQIKKGEEPPSF